MPKMHFLCNKHAMMDQNTKISVNTQSTLMYSLAFQNFNCLLINEFLGHFMAFKTDKNITFLGGQLINKMLFNKSTLDTWHNERRVVIVNFIIGNKISLADIFKNKVHHM